MSVVADPAPLNSWIVPLGDLPNSAVERVGGKGFGLSRLVSLGLRAPAGFVVTTDSYLACVGRVQQLIDGIVSAAQDPVDVERAAAKIGDLFADDILTAEISSAISAAYDDLGGDRDAPVAVRSSATAEDTPEASFAGQQDTYLWISGAEQVARHVVRCWASLYTARAITYRRRQSVEPASLAMAVVVQEMVPAAAAGVMMTLEPTSGDRAQIYIESVYGLGEGVVRGDVDPDRFTVAAGDLSVLQSIVGSKDRQYILDEDSWTVQCVPVLDEKRIVPSLVVSEVRELAALGRRIAAEFGGPMDIEWAIADRADGTGRDLHLLQARPETVWSNRPGATAPEAWDTLHSSSAAGTHWSTSNVGEAVPGVQTTLSWSIWGPHIEAALKESAFAVGALSAGEREVRIDPDERYIRPFFGRPALDVGFLALVGDRMPGTTGPEAVRSLLGRVPEDYEFRPTRSRYPMVASRLPRTFVGTPRKLRAMRLDYDLWWRTEVGRVRGLDRVQAQASLAAAVARHRRALVLHTIGVVGVIQPAYDLLQRLVERAGTGDLSALAGAAGGAEMAIVEDLWDASRGVVDLAEVVRRHGFHGPEEGELSSVVWREDDSPLRAVVEQYAARGDELDPRRAHRERLAARVGLERVVIDALPAVARPAGSGILRLSRNVLPLRGTTKRSFLQSLDVARASARRYGEHLVLAGELDDRDDVFHLTVEELTSSPGRIRPDARELVALRRARREEYLHLVIPPQWVGEPPRSVQPSMSDRARVAGDDVIEGVGVSSGVVEGAARVLLRPDFTDVGSDEILVSPTTDPSWASIMFVSSALIVDVGGALSHAAVVARELGIPCVVNTREGTSRIRTGDRVRVDGRTGIVEILERADG